MGIKLRQLHVFKVGRGRGEGPAVKTRSGMEVKKKGGKTA